MEDAKMPGRSVVSGVLPSKNGSQLQGAVAVGPGEEAALPQP